MGRLPIVVLLLVLVLAPALPPPAGADVQGPPDWKAGDRWEYRIVYKSPLGTTFGNLTQEVTAVGPVRVGNRTVDAYTLSSHQRTMGFGVNSSASSRTYISKSDLGTLSINTTSSSHLGELSSSARMETRYDASDGRYRFPLGVGTNWSVEYNLSRRVLLSPGLIEENRTVYGQSTCEAIDRLSVGAGRFQAYRVTCTFDSGNVTTYWYSEGVRGDVKREEMDPMTGSMTIYTLERYVRAAEPFPLLGSDTGRAILLGIISGVLLLSALALVLARRRATKPPAAAERKDSPPAPERKKAPGAGPAAASVELACPACRRRFRVPAGTVAVKCPFCGKQGRPG